MNNVSMVSPSQTNQKFRVMVVEDSAVIRAIMIRILDADPEIKVVATAANGQLALDTLKNAQGNIDVILLDIEMPVMDGLTALPQLLKIDPTVPIIMSSTLTVRNAEISLKALHLGATDYIPKPVSSQDAMSSVNFQHDLLAKVKIFGARHKQAQKAPATPPKSGVSAPSAPLIGKPSLYQGKPVNLRPLRKFIPEAIAIGSSTGGPQALIEVMRGLGGLVNQPIFITQHMPPRFTAVLANHISVSSGKDAREAQDGEVISPGRIYVAPGDYHMTIRKEGTTHYIQLNQGPHENFCRPSVDPMFRSLSEIYGNGLWAAVLTGMGSDGLEGGKKVVERGGSLIAQDEVSSVVWGMPGAVATAGLCSAVVPLNEIAQILKTLGKR